jgi:hypothetical protein
MKCSVKATCATFPCQGRQRRRYGGRRVYHEPDTFGARADARQHRLRQCTGTDTQERVKGRRRVARRAFGVRGGCLGERLRLAAPRSQGTGRSPSHLTPVPPMSPVTPGSFAQYAKSTCVVHVVQRSCRPRTWPPSWATPSPRGWAAARSPPSPMRRHWRTACWRSWRPRRRAQGEPRSR